MADRVFVDTNVLIYAYSDTEPEKKEISLITLENKNIIISTQEAYLYIFQDEGSPPNFEGVIT